MDRSHSKQTVDWARPKGGNLGIGFEFEELEFWVDPRVGARTTIFAFEGRNILTGPDSHTENYGSTLWTSPQSDWDWPPPAELDNLPYEITIGERDFTLQSSVSSRFGVRFKKTYRASPSKACIVIDYTLQNCSSGPVRLAPWEVTRVRGGLSFYPEGGKRFNLPHQPAIDVVDAAGITWFAYDESKILGDQKIFAHAAAGWLAHVDENLLFLKSFPHISENEQAPGEALVEVYARGDHTYIELEQQGAFREIPAHGEVSWPVIWQLARLPRSLDIGVNSSALREYAQGLFEKSRAFAVALGSDGGDL